MSPSMRFSGSAVSAGVATGSLHVADVSSVVDAGPAEVRAAFAAVAADRRALADRLRRAGRDQDAAIIEVGALIAADTALVEPAVAAVGEGSDPVAAIRQAAQAQAVVLEALPVPELALRADDVRQVAQAVLDHLGRAGAAPLPAGDFILIGREVSPADLIQLADAGLVGAVSVAGGASSHAAIIARGLGLPMVAGVDPAVLAAPSGHLGLLDADAGELLVGPSPAELAAVSARSGEGQREHQPEGQRAQPGKVPGRGDHRPGRPDHEPARLGHHQGRPEHPPGRSEHRIGRPGYQQSRPELQAGGPARTKDGREIAVLCNVASAAETRRGLAAGAAGVGLLRTEIPYIGALAWPTPDEHRAQLAPILGLLAGKTATVRLLDFSGDKIPPFLRGRPSAAAAEHAPWPGGAGPRIHQADVAIGIADRRHEPGAARQAGERRTVTGLAALLAHPSALRDQLEAVLQTGGRTSLAVLVPMVSSLEEVAAVREVLSEAAADAGVEPPPLGIMVELQVTAAGAGEFAAAVDFFSIGTNDLTGQVLGLDRRDPAAKPSLAAHPLVLELIAQVTAAGRRAGIPVSVCGDSAADPLVLPLLVGLGVRVLSVPAAQVRQVRSGVAALDTRACAALAADALTASTADEVWKLVRAR